jgi:hypothetical protein
VSKKTVQRRSQLITTFGPGAMVDLPTRSVLIGGLHRWRMPTDSHEEIDEPALARLLERWLREQGRLDEGEAIRLLTPPVAEGDGRGNPPGVDVTIFPTWFVCERVETPTIGGEENRGRRLVRWCDLDPASGRRRFVHDDGKKDDVTPLRFVGACPNGHLQDIDWRRLLHAGVPCQEPMWLADRGTSGLLGDLEIICNCGARLTMKEATKPGRLGLCDGHMPWISAQAREDCTIDGRSVQLRLLSRSATNAYFAQTISVISLPKGEDELTDIVEQHRADLAEVESVEDVRQARRFNSALRMALDGHDDTAVFERLQLIRMRAGEERSANPRISEFEVLASGQAEIGVNTREARLYARTLPRSAWQSDGGRGLGMIHSVVPVHRLREVMCLYGFTRLEPAPTASEGNLEEIQLAVRGAPIAERPHWLPTIEQLGEGIFICFDPHRDRGLAATGGGSTTDRRADRRLCRASAQVSGAGRARLSRRRLHPAAQPGACADHGDRARLRLSRELAEGAHLRFRAGAWRAAALRHPALCRLARCRRHARRSRAGHKGAFLPSSTVPWSGWRSAPTIQSAPTMSQAAPSTSALCSAPPAMAAC